MRNGLFLLSCSLVGLALSGAPSAALADTPEPTNGEQIALEDKARALYDEGEVAYSESRWGEARASYLAAWALKKHWQIAANLADCEARLSRYRDAAEHAAYYRDEAPADRRARAEGLLAEAMKHVSALKIAVDQEGADVLIDDEPVGRTPLDREVFVEPGARTIVARIAGRADVVITIDVAAGQSATAVLSFAKGGGKPSSADARIVLGGAVIGSLAAVTGVVFTLLSSVAASDADSRTDKLAQSGKSDACSRNPSECEGISASRSDRDTFANVAVATFVGAGVIGGATVVYALLAPSKAPVVRAETGLRVAPALGFSEGGVVLSGSF